MLFAFSIWANSLTFITSRPTFFFFFYLKWSNGHDFYFLKSWIQFHSMKVPHFHYLFIDLCRFNLFLFLRYCESSSNECVWASLCSITWGILVICIRNSKPGSFSPFQTFWSNPCLFPWYPYHVSLYPAVNKVSPLFSHIIQDLFLLVFLILAILEYDHKIMLTCIAQFLT